MYIVQGVQCKQHVVYLIKHCVYKLCTFVNTLVKIHYIQCKTAYNAVYTCFVYCVYMIYMLCIHVVYILVAQSLQHTYLYLNFCVIFWKKFDGSLVEVADSAYKLNHSGHEFTSSFTKEPAACKYHNQHHNRRQIMDRRTMCAARTGQDEC